MENSLEKDPDAIKLFIGQIPKSYTDVDLRQLFSIYGAIYELTILREKNTNAHRGANLCMYVHMFTVLKAVFFLRIQKVKMFGHDLCLNALFSLYPKGRRLI